eukprot:CAMPEP_0184321906 /NCGR_PEP_ID=MMETSP1049-20130417/121825_1 /TAXON_ID=77928 /ORGANISM="Proteomonas sulcata, Strain CCMP704" /LENGTH=76 /DNA_ID=CAMNT_0026642881 /DNA_START=845 /DNA_END=1075 /DNA_ORIENTATION=-
MPGQVCICVQGDIGSDTGIGTQGKTAYDISLLSLVGSGGRSYEASPNHCSWPDADRVEIFEIHATRDHCSVGNIHS